MSYEFETPLYIEFTSDGNILEFLTEKKGIYTYKYVRLQDKSTIKIGSFVNWNKDQLWKVMMSQFSVCHYNRIDQKLDPVIVNGAKGFTEEEIFVSIKEEELKRKEVKSPAAKTKKPKQDIQGKLF